MDVQAAVWGDEEANSVDGRTRLNRALLDDFRLYGEHSRTSDEAELREALGLRV